MASVFSATRASLGRALIYHTTNDSIEVLDSAVLMQSPLGRDSTSIGARRWRLHSIPTGDLNWSQWRYCCS